MGKYAGVTITVSTDGYGETGDKTLERVIGEWEDFLSGMLGVEIANAGGESMRDSFRIDDWPEDRNLGELEAELSQDIAEAWEDFCSQA